MVILLVVFAVAFWALHPTTKVGSTTQAGSGGARVTTPPAPKPKPPAPVAGPVAKPAVKPAAAAPAVEPVPEPAAPEPTPQAGVPRLDPAPKWGTAGPRFHIKWRKVGDLPEPRTKFGAAVYGGLIWIAGGESANAIMNSVITFDPVTHRFGSAPSLSTPRSNHGVTVAAGKLLVFGGLGDGKLLGSVEVWNPTARAWRTLNGEAASMPTARSGFAYCTAGNLVYTFGGDKPAVETFDAAAERWTQAKDMTGPLAGAAAVTWKGLVYLIGGYGLRAPEAAVQVWDPAADTWLPAAPPLIGPRSGLVAVTDATGATFAVAGTRGTVLDLIEVCRTPGEPWTPMNSFMMPRTNHAFVIARGRFYAIGGTGPGVPERSVFEGTIVRD